MRILVIDDDRSVGTAIQAFLSHQGCEVVAVESGSLGVQAFETSSFEALMVDIFMPGVDGLKVIKSFRHRAPSLPIIAMSGSRFRDSTLTSPDVLGMAAALGATSCLRKPFGPQELRVAINALIDQGPLKITPLERIDAEMGSPMLPDTLRFDIAPAAPPSSYAVHTLNQLQADLIATARLWAMDEVSAALARQLSEPLTGLLISLHEIEQAAEHPPDPDSRPNPLWEAVGKAVCEAERVCTILERPRNCAAPPVNGRLSAPLGSGAVDARTGNGGNNGGSAPQPLVRPLPDSHPLTPREQEVLARITAGASNREGSKLLKISTRTFEAHRAHIMRKLGAKNAADLVRKVLRDIR
jgi:DNA-binding NarL/FixJ family response regulator